MKRPQEIADDVSAMAGMVQLTGIFESIASLRISQIKSQVQQSQQFFSALWNIYTQLRVDAEFRFGRSESQAQAIDKELFIIITGEGGFSGDIDQKLIQIMLKQYKPDKNDILVVGHHGAIQLAQNGIGFRKYFKLPVSDQHINAAPLIVEVQKYLNTTVFYQTYVSLMVQDVKRIALGSAIVESGQKAKAIGETISEENYIFEPSTLAVVDHLERSMLQIAISQFILESKLAQYASRFRAMTAAHSRADESLHDLQGDYNRARRAVKDERLKEIVNGLRQVRASA